MKPEWSSDEIVLCVQAVENFAVSLQELQVSVLSARVVNYEAFFQGLAMVFSEYKARQVKNSGIYWVVEIIEHETARLIDSRKAVIAPQLDNLNKTSM